ncbi:MAG: Bifunctional NAD(P)H-hydrate repair enzyme Nnr [Chlamydiae bacterium]|nr:Bifunctional NAD(P)H-hydrate repair enzyme Nnr [Chlamydiota bacterium]
MNGTPVVTVDEMKRLEKRAFAEGESDQKYMENAGAGIAAAVEKFFVTPTSDTIYLLIGKGNNGGDGFVAGEILLQKGFSVLAYHLYPIEECSPLSQKMAKRFAKAGGKMIHLQSEPTFEKGIILDGLIGTGFQGAAEGFLAEVIEMANKSQLPIFAIDIPSGLNGNTGEVQSIAIKAHTTLFLGLPKIGFYLKEGWNHVGKLVQVDFGMPERFVEDADPIAYLVSQEKAKKALPKIERSRHKYEAGYVLAIAGSPSMSGAAMMSCLATLKAGAGIIRLFYPEEMKTELTTAPYELIKEAWNLEDDTRIFEEAKRAKALLIGPGMGRTEKAATAAKNILAKTTLPTVLDADALYYLAQDKEMSLPEITLLTPHHQEMLRILDAPPTIENCLSYCKKKEVTLVLKGAPTIIFHPHTKPLIIPHGDPGMATAGTGDVLTGILAAFLAQGLDPRNAAGLGTFLHALAGEIAACEETSYGIIATDLIHFLPEAIQALQH